MASPAELLFGRAAVAGGLLRQSQLDRAVAAQEAIEPPPPLLVLLVEQGDVTWPRLDRFFVEALHTFAALGPSSREQLESWRLAARAVAADVLTPEAAGRFLRRWVRIRDTGGEAHTLLAVLREEGGLTEAQEAVFVALEPVPNLLPTASPADAGTLATPLFVPAVPRAIPSLIASGPALDLPPMADGLSQALPRTFGKFILEAELGRGGMGVVYKAWHPGLQRHYALKVLQAGSDAAPEDAERLRREAQAAAALHHPGIVRVHDVGELDGVTWLAMEFVDGRPLDEPAPCPSEHRSPGTAARPADDPTPPTPPTAGTTAPRFAPADAARIAFEVAEAIAAAHAVGVVHRDLKPANVLIDAQGKARVMDFGLARRLNSPQSPLTRVGMVMGTPAYMSPEQAAGDMAAVREPTDIYQIGAILYELLTGHRPFDGDSPYDVLRRAASATPIPVRSLRPDVPEPIAVICEKAMAREIPDRYATARALAEDLARTLAGEPILARPLSRGVRAVRWVRRHRSLVALAGCFFFALLVAGGTTWRSRALRFAVLESLRSTAQTNLEAAMSVRRAGGNMRLAEQEFLPPLVTAVRNAEAVDPRLAEPRYHLGRLQRALLHFADARAAQEAALDRDPEFGPARYELAVLRAMELAASVDELRHAWDRDEGARLKAAGVLQQGGLGGISADARPTDLALVNADPAARALHRALLADLVRLEELGTSDGLTAADLDCARALARAYSAETGDDAAARAALEQVIQARVLREEAVEAIVRLHLERGRAIDADELLARGIGQDKGYLPYRMTRGILLRDIGVWLSNHGQDPGMQFQRAILEFDAALGIDDRCVEALRHRGMVYLYVACQVPQTEDVAEASYLQAVHDLDAALALAPGHAASWLTRADLHSRWGNLVSDRINPVPYFEASLRDFGQAIALRPEYGAAFSGRGELHNKWGSWQQNHGQDPEAHFAGAVSDFATALSLAPKNALTCLYRGLTRLNWASWIDRTGRESEAMYHDSIADLTLAVKLDPGLADAWRRRGGALCDLGQSMEKQGKDPTSLYEDAVASCSEALRINEHQFEAIALRGDTYFNWGLFLNRRGRRPDPMWESALKDYTWALQEDPGAARVYSKRVMLRIAWAEVRREERETARTLYEQAERDLDKAIKLLAEDWFLWNQCGMFHINYAMFLHRGEEPSAAHLDAAMHSLGRAIAINPIAADSWMYRGYVQHMRGTWELAEGRDPGPLFTAAMSDYNAAIDRNPRYAEAYGRRGTLFYSYRKSAEAIADLERALALNPSSTNEFRDVLELARRLGEVADDQERVLVLHRDAGTAMHAGDYAGATVLYEDMLRQTAALLRRMTDPARAALADAFQGPMFEAHYNLACVFALRSNGMSGPQDDPRSIPATERDHWRDRAFAHLGECGAADPDAGFDFAGDPDLAPLREDPRWREFMDRIRGPK